VADFVLRLVCVLFSAALLAATASFLGSGTPAPEPVPERVSDESQREVAKIAHLTPCVTMGENRTCAMGR
jgi:hypothetical protein